MSEDRIDTATNGAQAAAYMSTCGLASIMNDDAFSSPPSVLDRWLREREAVTDPLEDERDDQLEELDRIWEAAERVTCSVCGRVDARAMPRGVECSNGCEVPT